MHRIDFQRLFEALPSAHMLLDREYRFVAANAAYERVTMRSRQELIGKCLFDVFPNDGEGGRRLRESFDRVFETGESDSLAYVPYDIPRPEALGGGMEQRYWTAAHAPVEDREGNVLFLLQNTVDVTDFVRLRTAASLPFRSRIGESALIERAREAEEAHQALIDDSEAFRSLFQQAPGFIASLAGADHVFTFTNDAYMRVIGGRQVIGTTVREALPEIEGQGMFEMLDAVLQDGVQRGGESTRVMLRQAPGEEPSETFLDFAYSAIRDTEGNITGVFVQGMDRTETVRAQARQRLLIDEVNHRVKNTLATVQSLAAQTFRSAEDTVAARAAFEARLQALSKAHNLLSERKWEGAELATIVAREFEAYDEGRGRAEGPPVLLNANAAITFAMILHELASNAVKFGALSSDTGSISVAWMLDGEERLQLRWIEQGGPAASKPTRTGFGSRMIDRSVTGELAGSYLPNFSERGFSCELRVPLARIGRGNNEFV